MRHPLASLALAATVAAPAYGQIAERPNYGPAGIANPFLSDSRLPGPGVWRDLHDIRGRIDAARDAGEISRREARQLNRQARQIGRLADRYGSDGLTPSERAELDARALALRSQVGATRTNGGH